MLLKYFPPKNKHGSKCTDVGQPAKIMKNLYNTTEGVRKWMRELNVDVGFETKKRKVERTRMLPSEAIIG